MIRPRVLSGRRDERRLRLPARRHRLVDGREDARARSGAAGAGGAVASPAARRRRALQGPPTIRRAMASMSRSVRAWPWSRLASLLVLRRTSPMLQLSTIAITTASTGRLSVDRGLARGTARGDEDASPPGPRRRRRPPPGGAPVSRPSSSTGRTSSSFSPSRLGSLRVATTVPTTFASCMAASARSRRLAGATSSRPWLPPRGRAA